MFIIREREPRADNTETGYEAFVTTGGIHEIRPTSLAMAKNNMDDPQVHSRDSNFDAANSEHFGVVVNSETVGKLQLSNSLRINVTLNSLLKAATSRMPWLLVLEREKFKEMFVDLGQQSPEKEIVGKPDFAGRRSQPEIHVQPQRRLFQFIRHRRDVNLHSDPTPFFLVPEMQRLRKKHSYRPEDAEFLIGSEPWFFPVGTIGKLSEQSSFVLPGVDVTQEVSPPPAFVTVEPGNHQFSSPLSPVSPETMFNHESSVFRTKVTYKDVVSSTPYVTSETINYHLSSSLLPTITAENVPEYNPIPPILTKKETHSKKSLIFPSKVDNIQVNSPPSDLTTAKYDDHKRFNNSSSSLFPYDTTNKTTINSSSPDNYPTGYNHYRLSFPSSSISFAESNISEINSPTAEFSEKTNQSSLATTVADIQFNSTPPVLTPTAVVSNEQHHSSSTATKTTKIQSGPCSSATNYGGIINFRDNEDEKGIPMEQIERLMPILKKHTTEKYRQLTPHEELPKPEAIKDFTG